MLKELKAEGKTSGKILEVRGLPGNSVDRDRSIGIHEALDASGGQLGSDPGGRQLGRRHGTKSQRRRHCRAWQVRRRDRQGGTTGVVQAMLDAEHPMVPIAGESENGYRKLVAKYADKGLKGIPSGSRPDWWRSP